MQPFKFGEIEDVHKLKGFTNDELHQLSGQVVKYANNDEKKLPNWIVDMYQMETLRKATLNYMTSDDAIRVMGSLIMLVSMGYIIGYNQAILENKEKEKELKTNA